MADFVVMLLVTLGSVQVLHQCVWGGLGGLSQNADTADTLKGRGGRVETYRKYCCKILEIINKLMNFFLSHALISPNTASTAQNIFLILIEKHILII